MKPILTRAAQLIRPQDKLPVPYTPRAERIALPSLTRNDATQQLAVYGADSVVFPIVNQLANATASVTWRLYRKARSGNPDDRTEYQGHAAADLWRKPNPWMTCQELVETLQQHIDLTGEGWLVIGRDSRMPTPLELWPMRPDRVQVVPSHDEFIRGYVYHGPDGELVPLEPKDVIQIRMPNPMDPYRGLGPIQAAMTDLDAARYAAMWNRNFFLNSAEPGGIIEVDRHLSDDEFDELATRWGEQHKGVANSHRVAILEKAQWKDRKITQRDMQFADLRSLSDEKIRQAFAFPKPMLGSVDDVNLANARAAETVFSRWRLVPRLERWKAALNNDLLPLFGQRDDLEFDYDNPTPADPEQEIAERDSVVNAVVALINVGFDPTEVTEWAGLPPMQHIPQQELMPSEPSDQEPELVALIRTALTENRSPSIEIHTGSNGHDHRHGGRPEIFAQGEIAAQAEDDPPSPELQRLQADWQAALDRLIADWGPVVATQRSELVAQIQALIDAGDIVGLANLSASSDVAAELLAGAMVELADRGAQRESEDAANQGVNLPPGEPDRDSLIAVAMATAALLAAGLAGSAAREALRVFSSSATGSMVGQQVMRHLESLSLAHLRDVLGGALSTGQAEGRESTMREADRRSDISAAYYADERLDGRQCQPCDDVDGRWLGETVEQVQEIYPGGRYRGCLGGERCRGQVAVVYRGNEGPWFESERQTKENPLRERRRYPDNPQP